MFFIIRRGLTSFSCASFTLPSGNAVWWDFDESSAYERDQRDSMVCTTNVLAGGPMWRSRGVTVTRTWRRRRIKAVGRGVVVARDWGRLRFSCCFCWCFCDRCFGCWRWFRATFDCYCSSYSDWCRNGCCMCGNGCCGSWKQLSSHV